MEKELEKLKKSSKLWYNFDTGTSGIIFIKLNEAFYDIISPQDLSQYILE